MEKLSCLGASAIVSRYWHLRCMSSPPGGDRMQSKCEISRATFGNCLKASLYYYYASASASSFLNWIVTLGWVLSSQKSILTLSLSLYNFSGKRPKIQISNSFCHITAWHCEIWLTWTQSLKSHVRFQKEDCCWKESLLCVTNIVKKSCVDSKLHTILFANLLTMFIKRWKSLIF